VLLAHIFHQGPTRTQSCPKSLICHVRLDAKAARIPTLLKEETPLERPDNTAGGPPDGGPPPIGELERRLCQVGGLNQNYTSSAGTLYHIQIEDRGPILDRVLEREVRRVNVIVYANYGEPNARIVHGRDHDFPDLRTHDHNRFITQKIQELAEGARLVVEEKEQRQVTRIKAAIREYYLTKDERAKSEFEEANTLYPFLFSRAWKELKLERERTAAIAAAATPSEPTLEAAPVDVIYPLDAELRERVLEIERIIADLGRDVEELKARGSADDILLQTCRKLVTRAQEGLSESAANDFSARRLDMMRNSLATTWRQVRSRLK